MGQGTPTGAADDRGRGARHELRPDEDDHARHERHAEPGRRASAARACRRAASRPAPRPRRRRRRCSSSPSTNLGVAGGEPHGQGRRRLGRRQDRHLRRADRRQAVQRQDHGLLDGRQRDDAGAGRRGLAGHEAGQPVQARRHEPAAGRHPGQGHGQVHLRRTTSACPGCSTAASCGRAARAPTATARRRRSSRSTRARSSTSRARRSSASANFLGVVAPTGVRGDPGGGPAEGEVGRPAGAAGRREPLEADARPRQRRQGAGADRVQHAATSTTRSSRRRTRCTQTLQVPLHGPPADRPVAAASPT